MIRLICIGKTHAAYVREGMDEFIKRISHYAKFELVCIPDIKNTRNMDADMRKKEEGKLFLRYMESNTFNILLDEAGKKMNSVQFARQLESWMGNSYKGIHFYIGGPYGFSAEINEKAQSRLSLSEMTFNHELVRLVFTEQLYRAFSIINKEPYHHG